MKATFSVLLLCLAYACAAAIEKPEFDKLVNEQKVIVEGIQKNLKENKEKMAQVADVELRDKKAEAVKDIQTVINSGRKDIQERFEIVFGDHADPEVCFETATTKFNTLELTTKGFLDVCYKGAVDIVETPRRNMNKMMVNTESIMANLNAVIPKCNDPDVVKMQKCVDSTLAQIEPAINKLKNNVEDIKEAGEEAVKTAILKTKVCKISTFNTAQHFVFGTDGIRYTAALCLWMGEGSHQNDGAPHQIGNAPHQ